MFVIPESIKIFIAFICFNKSKENSSQSERLSLDLNIVKGYARKVIDTK